MANKEKLEKNDKCSRCDGYGVISYQPMLDCSDCSPTIGLFPGVLMLILIGVYFMGFFLLLYFIFEGLDSFIEGIVQLYFSS